MSVSNRAQPCLRLPPGWAWFCASLPDGRQHRFGYAANADAGALLRRAWEIWSPARTGPDGRFLAAGLAVAPDRAGR